MINSNAYLNIVSSEQHRMYEGKAIFITSDLLDRTIKLVDIIRNEFFIRMEN